MQKHRKHPIRLAVVLFACFCLTLGGGYTLYWVTAQRLSAAFVQKAPPLVPVRTEPITVKDQKTPGLSEDGPVLKEAVPAGEEYLDSTVFVGDSRVCGMRNHKVIASKNTFAYNGLSHSGAMTKAFIDLGDGISRTIPEAVGIRKPKRMVVAFGINGIAWMGIDSFIQGYENLLDELIRQSPESIVIVQSILPVSSSKEQSDPRLANSKIDQYNKRLMALAEEKGAYYLNTAEALKNRENALDSRYDRGDGLHFSKAASAVIVDYFLSHPV